MTVTTTVLLAPGASVKGAEETVYVTPSAGSWVTAAVKVRDTAPMLVTTMARVIDRPAPLGTAPNDWLTGSSPATASPAASDVEQAGPHDLGIPGHDIGLRVAQHAPPGRC